MRGKRSTSRNYASNTELSDDASACEMEREQRRVRSNRLSQQRYREKGNEARNLLPQLYSRIAELERENNFLKDLLWRERDPNGYAVAQQQKMDWKMMNGQTNNADMANSFPQRVMSENSIPSLFNGQPVQQMAAGTEMLASDWQPPTNVVQQGANYYAYDPSAVNNAVGGCATAVGVVGQQQQANTQNFVATNGVGIARTRPIKRPNVRRSVSALNIPMNVMTGANGTPNAIVSADNTSNNNCGQIASTAPSPQQPVQQFLTADGTTNFGRPAQSSPQQQQQQNTYGHTQMPGLSPAAADGQWLHSGATNGVGTAQSESPRPIQAQPQQPPGGYRCRSASVNVINTHPMENNQQQQMMFNTSMGSNNNITNCNNMNNLFAQSMPRQISPAESPFELSNMHQQYDISAYDNEQQQLLSCPSAPKRSASFTDMCASYQQMNIQENMQQKVQSNDMQQQQQNQQQFEGFFAPPFAYGIELDPNGPQPKISSQNQQQAAAQFASFKGIELTPINEDTPRLYLEH